MNVDRVAPTSQTRAQGRKVCYSDAFIGLCTLTLRNQNQLTPTRFRQRTLDGDPYLRLSMCQAFVQLAGYVIGNNDSPSSRIILVLVVAVGPDRSVIVQSMTNHCDKPLLRESYQRPQLLAELRKPLIFIIIKDA